MSTELANYKNTCLSILNKIDLCEILQTIDRELLVDLDWLLSVWKNEDDSDELFDARKVADIEDRLSEIPFFEATTYKSPVDDRLACECLDINAVWITNPCVVMAMSLEEKVEIHRKFEYMCYFVINAREELQFDLRECFAGL